MKINEMFLSIQGEGVQSGLPTFFIRTTGCNLRCSYCDTAYAYNQGKNMSIKMILDKVQKQPFKIVCLTGGEPLLQRDQIKVLIKGLIKMGYKINIETNGSIDLRDFPKSKQTLYSMDIKCPSSGFSERMKYENLKLIKKKDQIKFIIFDKKDYNFAKNIVKKYNLINKTNIIFTPVGGINGKKLVNYILKDGLSVRIGLQIHKIIWGNKKRGV